MFDINWGDPDTFWLNVTNIGLGVVVVICVAIIATSIVREALSRRRARTTTEDEVFAIGDHAFDVRGLGMTMADGGDEVAKSRPPARRNNRPSNGSGKK